METWMAVAMVIAAVVVVDWLFRKHFRQDGDRTVGARQRGPQVGWKRPTGEVIDELTEDAALEERSDS